MGYPAYFAAYGGKPPPRTGASHATIYPYGPFTAADGKTVFLGIQNEREWASFCAMVLERPELAADPRFNSSTQRDAHRAELSEILLSVFQRLDSTRVLERLESAQIANARLNDMHAFWDHEQLKARNRWREVETPNGRVEALLPPVALDGEEPRMDPIPSVGQHTHAILSELGFDEAFIARLKNDQAI